MVTSDTKNLSYYQRLSTIEDRIEFEFTCRNLTELINSPVIWGVDSVGKVFDLSNRERFKMRTSSIRKIKPGLIWLNRISYPFEVDKTINLEEIDSKVLKIITVYIDKTWVLYKVTYTNTETDSILLWK
mgnify:CR=1 FL=1